MKLAAAVRNSGMAVAFATALLTHGGPAVGATSNYCSTHTGDRITTCFLDLRKSSEAAGFASLNGGIFVGTAAALGSVGGGQQPSLSSATVQQANIPHKSGGQTPSQTSALLPASHDLGIQIPSGSIRLGDITKVTVCDIRDRTSRDCEQYYEFLLDAADRADANGNVSLDEFRIFSGPVGDARYDMDGGPKGDVSVVTNDNPNSNDLRALIPASTFAGLTDDTFVYVYTAFNGGGNGCQEGSRESPCPVPGLATELAAVPLPATAFLLGIGLVGMVGMRRRRSPDFGSPH